MLYVDKLIDCGTNSNWRWKKYCHLISDDSVDELIKFGKKIGLKPKFIQHYPYPHFDLNFRKRNKALENGAKEIDGIKLLLEKNTHI